MPVFGDEETEARRAAVLWPERGPARGASAWALHAGLLSATLFRPLPGGVLAALVLAGPSQLDRAAHSSASPRERPGRWKLDGSRSGDSLQRAESPPGGSG